MLNEDQPMILLYTNLSQLASHRMDRRSIRYFVYDVNKIFCLIVIKP